MARWRRGGMGVESTPGRAGTRLHYDENARAVADACGGRLEAAQARGGGRSGTDGTDAIVSSMTSSVPRGGAQVTMAVTSAGGGNDTPHENHSATMPPQASMARSTTTFGCGVSFSGSSSDWSMGAGVAASDRYSLQISGPSRSSDGVEQAGWADFLAQHPDPAFCGSAATLRSSAARTAASTL